MSQQQTHTTSAGGVTYAVHYVPPDEAIVLTEDLLKVGGEAVITALVNMGVGDSLIVADTPAERAELLAKLVDGDEGTRRIVEGIAAAARQFVQRFDGKAWLRLTEAMMRVTLANGQPMSLNGQAAWKLHFAGKPAELRHVVLFALGVNFGGFFGVGPSTLGSVTGRLSTMATGMPHPPSPSPPASAGGSGAS